MQAYVLQNRASRYRDAVLGAVNTKCVLASLRHHIKVCVKVRLHKLGAVSLLKRPIRLLCVPVMGVDPLTDVVVPHAEASVEWSGITSAGAYAHKIVLYVVEVFEIVKVSLGTFLRKVNEGAVPKVTPPSVSTVGRSGHVGLAKESLRRSKNTAFGTA